MNSPSVDRAKLVVAEIVRQSAGDELVGKARLYKAFYFAHLFYALKNVGYLTDWPIVKMPMGPGIGDFDVVVKGLVDNRVLDIGSEHVGPFKAVKYRAIADKRAQLEPEAIDAIRQAVEFVVDKTGAQLSDITHEFSRSWRDADLGDELSIYMDLLSDDDYDAAKKRAAALESEIQTAWND